MIRKPEKTSPLVELDTQQLLETYRHMVTARHVDVAEQDLLRRGEAFFMVSGAGHEAVAALAPHLTPSDWLHCHYRDKALMLARGMSAIDFIRAELCRKTSHSAGRQMSAHMADMSRNVLSLVGPVGNSALQAAGVAAAVKDRPGKPIVYLGMGDGTTQEGEVLEAIGETVRWGLPVLFLIQDNRFAISTVTEGMTFYSLPGNKQADSFNGISIRYVNGWDVIETARVLAESVQAVRQNRFPEIVVMKVERLWSHTNADDHRVYRTAEDIDAVARDFDPILHLAAHLQEHGIERAELDRLEEQIRAEVSEAVEQALFEPDPEPFKEAKRPLPPSLTRNSAERRGNPDAEERATMLEAIREVLGHHLRTDERVSLYGQDIQDPKGDVFGVTKGLTAIDPNRVRNSPLAEATIVGTGVGRAIAGERPVVFLQFADFFPLAFNQIISELGSVYWRSNGASECPVIVMITCGGYRPGLGPFHAHTMDSIAAHTPGVDVFMPSTAADAAGMLNAAFASGRPTLYFYPKNCLNDRSQTTSANDLAEQFVPIGRARLEREGSDLTLVAWGNGVEICRRTADALETVGLSSELIDLRSLSPWDDQAVLKSAEKTGRLIVVHEDNLTCGFGAEVLASVAEKASRPVEMRRVARPDTYVPCNFRNQLEILPSFKRTLEVAAELMELDLHWEKPIDEDAELFVVEALGSSPSDESITVIEWKITEGEDIQTGQMIAEVEADKAAFELTSPTTGRVEKLLIAEGEAIKVGMPLVHVRIPAGQKRPKPLTQEQSGTPILKRRAGKSAPAVHAPAARPATVGLSEVSVRIGSRKVTNEEIIRMIGDEELTSQSIVERTGIVERSWIGEGENALTLGTDAARELLERESLEIGDIELLICSTGTPVAMTPSMGCLILNRLAPEEGETLVQAYDVNAACSGYLYALQIGYDYLASRPDAKVLVVTTETLSPQLNPKDLGTVILFGDAATATLMTAGGDSPSAVARLHRPVNSAKGDDGSVLCVPVPGSDGFVSMKGKKVFSEAVTKMTRMLEEACEQSGMKVEDLTLVVPHQANQRIIDAIRRRAKLPEERVFSNISHLGNTSSSTIPICLKELFAREDARGPLGLCSFGGGFTFGAAVVENLGK